MYTLTYCAADKRYGIFFTFKLYRKKKQYDYRYDL